MINKTLSERIAELNEIKKSYEFEPIVGQRYRNKRHQTFIVVESIKDGWITTKGFCKIQLSNFWHWFEELPEDNLQEKKEVSEVERASEELKEVLGVRDVGRDRRLKDHYKLHIRAQSLVTALEAEKRPSIKYVQHLESQLAEMTEAFERLTKEKDMSKPEPKIDMKEECIEPVSIWKDLFLGELDVDNDELYLMQYDGGVRLGVVLHHDALDEYDISIIGKGIYPKIEQKAIYADKCCSLTDFVKSFEQMQKDIEELKKK